MARLAGPQRFEDVEESDIVLALTQVLNDPNARGSDRNKAAELLAQYKLGRAATRQPETQKVDASLPVPQDPDKRREYVQRLADAYPDAYQAVRQRLGAVQPIPRPTTGSRAD